MSAPTPIYPYSDQPSPIDLTTLEAVKDYLATNEGAIIASGADTADDLKIQALITGLSQYWLTKTSRASLNSVLSYQESYDGPGGVRIFMDNYPITGITTLQINNQTIPQSAQYGVAGWVIERGGKSIALRGVGGNGLITTVGFPGGTPYSFCSGIANVFVDYTAGYSGIPNDIFEACTWQVAQAYKKREQINLESMQMGGGAGAATYVKWDWTPEVRDILNTYKRIPVPSGSSGG